MFKQGIWPKFGHCSWCFRLAPIDQGQGTRFVMRARFACSRALGPLLAVFEPADFIQQHKMLLGIKRRAEQLAKSKVIRHVEGHIALSGSA